MGFEKALEKTLVWEGGDKLTKDVDDPGGTTKYGISQKAHPDLDIENLTYEDAKEIYKKEYWDKSRAEKLPEKIQEQYFDMAVNLGRRRAVKILQKACNALSRDKIKEDGLIGKNTIRAAGGLEPNRFRAFRVMRYVKLVMNNPKLMKYYYGWYNRAINV